MRLDDLIARRSEFLNYILDPRNRIPVPNYRIIDIRHVHLWQDRGEMEWQLP